MGNERVSGWVVAGVCAALAFAVGDAPASKGASEEYEQRMKSFEPAAALESALFRSHAGPQLGERRLPQLNNESPL